MYKKLATDFIKNITMPGKVKPVKGIHIKSEYIVLIYIVFHGEVLPKEISDNLNITSARVANVLNYLEDNKLITRKIDPDDRRKILVRPTNKGLEVECEQKKILIEKVSFFLEKLGEDDAKEYVRIMNKISNIMKDECVS